MSEPRDYVRRALAAAERAGSADADQRLALLEEVTSLCRHLLEADPASFGIEELAALRELLRRLDVLMGTVRCDQQHHGAQLAALVASRRARTEYARPVTFGDQTGLRA